MYGGGSIMTERKKKNSNQFHENDIRVKNAPIILKQNESKQFYIWVGVFGGNDEKHTKSYSHLPRLKKEERKKEKKKSDEVFLEKFSKRG